jgi:hypothetical protein
MPVMTKKGCALLVRFSVLSGYGMSLGCCRDLGRAAEKSRLGDFQKGKFRRGVHSAEPGCR